VKAPRSGRDLRGPVGIGCVVAGAAARDTRIMASRKDQHAALEQELLGERAAALGRVARRMEQALGELRAFDQERAAAGPADGDRVTRAELLAAAAEWVWFYIIQRESLGWYRHEEVVRMYDIPSEVYLRMGPRRPTGRDT